VKTTHPSPKLKSTRLQPGQPNQRQRAWQAGRQVRCKAEPRQTMPSQACLPTATQQGTCAWRHKTAQPPRPTHVHTAEVAHTHGLEEVPVVHEPLNLRPAAPAAQQPIAAVSRVCTPGRQCSQVAAARRLVASALPRNGQQQEQQGASREEGVLGRMLLRTAAGSNNVECYTESWPIQTDWPALSRLGLLNNHDNLFSSSNSGTPDQFTPMAYQSSLRELCSRD
jgi:hypothetical protein